MHQLWAYRQCCDFGHGCPGRAWTQTQLGRVYIFLVNGMTRRCYVGIIKGCESMRNARYGNSYCSCHSGVLAPFQLLYLCFSVLLLRLLVLYR